MSDERRIDVSVFCDTCKKIVHPKSTIDMESPAVDKAIVSDAIAAHGELVHSRARKATLEIRITIDDSGEQS